MGCTNTKLKAEEEPIPEKIRPLLFSQVLSQKRFLKQDREDDDESSDSLREKDDKVVKPCSNPEETGSRKDQEKVVWLTVEQLSKVVPLPDSAFQTWEDDGSAEQEKKDKDKEMNVNDKDYGPEEFKDAKDKDQEQDLVKDAETDEFKDAEDKVEVETEEGNNAEKVHEEVDGQNEDDDSDDPSKLCSGSPSFRIYCQPQKNEEEKKSENPHKSRRNLVHHKSLSADSIQSAASRNSSEIVGSSTKRKHKHRKFRAVKSLLNVKSCYYPSCNCAGDPDRNRLVAAKAVH
ncbi:hypothetical protein L6164_010906 [Bauhinia variegata]|uniref:Uncharacterized protein n=1 Tax=Bauhinia variegata TaxID=167791 RepID=A0ACB9P3Y5_BAUVA|nr:hypothetical protein L6164_010906 [Bauhinia variegata]